MLFLGNYRSLPVFQLLELVLNENVKSLDFSKNRDWIESEEMNEFARILWKIVGEKCRTLEKFVIPKELTYSSSLNSVIGESNSPVPSHKTFPNESYSGGLSRQSNVVDIPVNGSFLLQLTLKRNIPNNMFLHDIGVHCPNLQGRFHSVISLKLL